MNGYSEAAWKIASLYSSVLASETRDLAAHIDEAIAAALRASASGVAQGPTPEEVQSLVNPALEAAYREIERLRGDAQASPSDGAIYAAVSQRDMTQEEHELMMRALLASGEKVCDLPAQCVSMPIQPTNAILDALAEECRATWGVNVEKRKPQPLNFKSEWRERMKPFYRAMLKAYSVSSTERGQADALGYATRLLEHFVAEHFPHNPDWKPLPDLIGVLSQLDNAITIARDYKEKLRTYEGNLFSGNERGGLDLEQWIAREFTGHGVAVRLETDPPIPGEPLMSMAEAKELTRRAVRELDALSRPVLSPAETTDGSQS